MGGWRRWAGAAVFGSIVGDQAFHLYYVNDWRQRANHKQQRLEQMRKQVQAVQQAWDASRQPQGPLDDASPARKDTAASLAEAPLKKHEPSPSAVFIPAKGVPSQEKPGIDRKSWINVTNEPHLKSRSSPDQRPTPYANTNHTWTGTLGRAISELEAQLSKLRQRRLELAYESERIQRKPAEK